MYWAGVLTSWAMPAASCPNRFQFLGVAKLDLHQAPPLLGLLLFGDVVAKGNQFDRLAGLVAFVEEIPIDSAFVPRLGAQHHFIVAHRAVLQQGEELFDLAVFPPGINSRAPVPPNDFLGAAAGVFADRRVDESGQAGGSDARDHGRGPLDDLLIIVPLPAQVLLRLFILGDFVLERLVALLQFGGALGHQLLQALQVAFGLVE